MTVNVSKHARSISIKNQSEITFYMTKTNKHQSTYRFQPMQEKVSVIPTTATMKSLVIIILATLTSILADDIRSETGLFTAAVYKEISKNEKANFLVSPFSARTVLALAQSGAKGPTATEIRTSLSLPDDQTKIEASFKELLPQLKTQSEPYVFQTANKLYLQEDFAIKSGFKSVASDVFSADLENINFGDNVQAAKKINRWVEEQTQDKIHDLVKADKVGSDTKAVVVNALYFKGNWSVPFFNYTTKKRDFHQLDRKIGQVDTMALNDDDTKFNYSENEELGVTILELPFQGENVVMGFVLPNEKYGITQLEEKIDKVFLPQTFTREFVNISLPKFKIESEIDFKEILQNLGVTKAFTPGQADFSGISDNLVISDVIQKTFIDVNEDGVEAAAATYAGFTLFSAHYIPEGPKQFHADHPFIYYIKIKDLIVFAGRVAAPSY